MIFKMLLEKKEMESLEFINKIWVPDKPRIWERFLQVLIIIYCFLQIFIFIMDSNIDAKSCVFLILAIYAGFWISKQMKRKGKMEIPRPNLSISNIHSPNDLSDTRHPVHPAT